MNVNNNNLKVGIYLRLSDEDKNKINKNDNSESIKNQRNLLMEEIQKNKNYSLYDEYCDEDLSGAGTYRPEFERLIKDCENKNIDIVMAKSQSRFSRDMEIIEKYLHNKFEEWNIRFISIADNADTFNKGNKKSRQINGLVNEWYLEDVSNNIRTSFNVKMKKGEYISPFAPYGYEICKTNNNVLVIDPNSSNVVKLIYRLYLQGYGYQGIAKKLDDLNILCPARYKKEHGSKINIVSNKKIENIKWNSNAIKSILTNEVYIGNLIQGKRTTVNYKNKKIITKQKSSWIKKENTHDAIIDIDQFNKVNKIINEHQKPCNRSNLIHLFSSKVFCLECNSTFKKNSTKKHNYLICSANSKKEVECCNNKSIRYDILEKIILNNINSLVKKFYNSNIQNNSINKKQTVKTLEILLSNLQDQLGMNKKYLISLYEDKVNGIITQSQFSDLINNYNYKEKILEDKIIIVKAKIKEKNNEITNINNNFFEFNKLNRLLVNEFIDRIYIGKINDNNTRTIKIIWSLD